MSLDTEFGFVSMSNLGIRLIYDLIQFVKLYPHIILAGVEGVSQSSKLDRGVRRN